MKIKELFSRVKKMLGRQGKKNDIDTVRTVHPDTWKEIYNIWSEPTGSWWDSGTKNNGNINKYKK